jgi:hypothetical protein
VYSTVPGNYNSLTSKPTRNIQLNDFVPYLKEISKLTGEMKWSRDGIAEYDAWYYPHVKSITNDKTGTLRRLGDQVLKAAMLISLAESPSMMIEKRHIEEAIKECEACAKNVNRVVQGGSGKGIMAGPITIILRELLRAPGLTMSRPAFLKKFWNEGLTVQEFDAAMETYIASGAVMVQGTGAGMTYVLEESVAQEYGKQEKKLRSVMGE